MKTYFHIFVFLFFGNSVFSQENPQVNELLQNAEKTTFINPDESIRIASQILRNTNNASEIIQTNLILSKSYFAKGNLEEAFDFFFAGKKHLENSDFTAKQLEYILFGTSLFRTIGLYEITKNLQKDGAHFLVSNSNQPLALVFEKEMKWLEADSTQNNKKLKQLLFEIDSKTGQKNKEAILLKSKISNSLGTFYLSKGKSDSSQIYFEKALLNQRAFQDKSLQEAFMLVDYSKYFFETNNHQTAIDTLKKALDISKSFNNPFLDYAIFNQLSQNYLALKKEDEFIEFNQKATQSFNSVKLKESAASNAIFNIFQQNQLDLKEALTNELVSTKWTWGSIAALLVLIALFTRWFTSIKLKHSRDVINYLKLIQSLDKKEEPPAKSIGKSLGIPKETESLLLKKLDAFEKTNKYTSNEMSLAQMASQFDTNTKYLSEVINKHKGKNFNLYINSLRIKYIVKKLKTEPNYLNYKVSYLAEESGFSSHSSFATVFKNITGISPNVFIELLKKDLKKNKSLSA